MALKPIQNQGGGIFNSPAMKAVQAYMSYGTSLAGSKGVPTTNAQDPDNSAANNVALNQPQQAPQIPQRQSPYNPLQNRLNGLQQNSFAQQDAIIGQGFKDLYHPDVPQSVRDQAEPIFKSYYQRRYGGVA